MTIQDIPEEVIGRAQVLGYMPDEYTDPVFNSIRECSESGHDELVAKIDEVVPKFSNMALVYVFRRLMLEGGEKVKVAMFHSREVTKWVKANQYELHKTIHIL